MARGIEPTELDQFRERWRRRGELFTVAAFTSIFASASTDRWWPMVASTVAFVIGVLVISAAEADWWLPGRAGARAKTERMTRWSLLPEGGGTSADATAIVQEIARLNRRIEHLVEVLDPHDSDDPDRVLPAWRRVPPPRRSDELA